MSLSIYQHFAIIVYAYTFCKGSKKIYRLFNDTPIFYRQFVINFVKNAIYAIGDNIKRKYGRI